MKFELFLLLAISYSASTRENENDEGRPYEFGFTIDGQQHRHESKDVNGIVMGEFGFITADGIYHVTVYATDENGNFKILSMRNVRVSGPLDEPGYKFPEKTPTSDIQTHEKLIAPPETTTTTQAPTTNFKAPYQFTTLPSLNVPACGSCKLPSTTPRPAGIVKDNKLPFQTPAFQQKTQPESIVDKKMEPYYGNEEIIDRRYGELEVFPESEHIPTLPENYEPVKPSNEQQPPNFDNPTRNDDVDNDVPNARTGKLFNAPEKLQEDPRQKNHPDSVEVSPRFNQQITQQKPVESFKPSLPITVTNQQINVPGRDPIPIKDAYPNMVDGLPNGITENDMLDLLYKFNYTLGFHGHHEKGLKNGAKIGAYFVNGRDGISRVVEYIADENGYRPKVTFINLGYDSPDTPKEDTEKTFGLKGYEFTWFPI